MNERATPAPLVSPEWLAKYLDSVVVVDVRSYMDGRSGADEYRRGHIPGAVWADLNEDLAGPPAAPGTDGGRHPLPSPEAFAASMERLGIGDGSVVVAYDDMHGSRAARLWWMLRALGETAAVLDGGLPAWTSGLTTTVPEVPDVTFTPRPWPAATVVTGDAVAERIGRPGVVMIDARSADRFRGDENPIDDRFGHIPGAVSAPWEDNVHEESGRLRSFEEQRLRFAEMGALDADEVIVSCGSGVTACHNALVLDQLGVPTRLYVGSWSEWGSNPNRPIEAGPAV